MKLPLAYISLLFIHTGLLCMNVGEAETDATQRLRFAVARGASHGLFEQRLKEAGQAIRDGADVNTTIQDAASNRDWRDMPLITYAAGDALGSYANESGNFAMIQLLINNGANILSEYEGPQFAHEDPGIPVFFAYVNRFTSQLDSPLNENHALWLLLHGANLDVRSKDGYSYIAFRTPVKAMHLPWLLAHGLTLSDPDLKNVFTLRALNTLYGHKPLLTAIVTRTNAAPPLEAMKKKAKAGALTTEDTEELNEAVILAAAQNSNVLRDLLEAGEFEGSISDETLQTAFSRAAINGDVSFLQQILGYALERGVITADDKGWVAAVRDALRFAYGQRRAEALDYLRGLNNRLELGIDVQEALQDILRPSDRTEETGQPQEKETEGKGKEKERQKEKETETSKKSEQPAIITAAYTHQFEEVKKLVLQGADPNTLGTSGRTSGANVVAALVDIPEDEQEVIETLEWLEQYGADMNQVNPEGFSVISRVSRSLPTLLRWLFEHGVRLTQNAFSDRLKERTMEQVTNAYPEPLLQAIILAPFVDRAEAIINKTIDELQAKEALAQPDVELINRAFTLSVAQNNPLYKKLLVMFAQEITPESLQQALLVAAARGNYSAVFTITDHAQHDIQTGSNDWYQACLQALERAIAHNHGNIISRLLAVLPMSASIAALDNIRNALAHSSLASQDRISILKSLDNAVQKAQREERERQDHLSSTVTAALGRIIQSIPSGVIPSLVTLVFGSLERSQAK